MAKFGSATIIEESEAPTSGAIFYCDRPAPKDVDYALDDPWIIRLANDSRYVIARGGAVKCYDSALAKALNIAQQGLDFVSMRGAGDLTIMKPLNEHIVWWIEDDKLVLRIREDDSFYFEGAKPLTQKQPTRWHESYRFLGFHTRRKILITHIVICTWHLNRF